MGQVIHGEVMPIICDCVNVVIMCNAVSIREAWNSTNRHELVRMELKNMYLSGINSSCSSLAHIFVSPFLCCCISLSYVSSST